MAALQGDRKVGVGGRNPFLKASLVAERAAAPGTVSTSAVVETPALPTEVRATAAGAVA